MSKKMAVWLGAGFLLLAAALGAAEPGKVTKLTAFLFSAEKGGVTLMADVDATRLRGGEKYIPMRVWLGKDNKGTIDISRGSFTLTDPKGASHPVASVDEVRTGYGPNLIAGDYQYDHRVVQSGEQVSDHFHSYNFVSAPVYFANPSGGPSVLHENAQVQMRTYTGTFLYFANPAGRDSGTYTLTFKDPGHDVEVSVSFTIDWSK